MVGLEAGFLFVSCARTLILAVCGVEVIGEVEAYGLGVGVSLVVGGADAVVGDHVAACRAEDVVGKQGGNEIALEERLL